MSRRFSCLIAFGLAAGCVQPVVQGGNNTNDRSDGGEQGEVLLTGAMTVSPDGKFILAQRNQTSVLVSIEGQTYRELPEQVERFLFAESGSFAIGLLGDHTTVVAYALPDATEMWRITPPWQTSTGPSLARLSDDGQYLLLGDADRLLVVETGAGTLRGTIPVGSPPVELSFVPGTTRALLVGSTGWSNHQPSTRVVDFDLPTGTAAAVDVPNCAAPVVVVPDGSRALMSPTFCQEGQASTSSSSWTNPDPVSIIDLSADQLRFRKNLPGFGPVAMDDQGRRAVAYLDVERMDPTMFDDPSAVPDANGPRYHIMTIDPTTLAYQLTPIGSVLPRFAMTRDGGSLLVDATVQQTRGDASLKATIDSNGTISVKLDLFGRSDSLFGLFDLDARTYVPFAGPAASLDRFVQPADAASIFTLKMTADGLGGDLYRIDLGARAATSLGISLRDIGLLPDGKTLVLRQRLAALQVATSAGFDWYRREKFCFSVDGIGCASSIEVRDSKPFQSGPACTSYHDC